MINTDNIIALIIGLVLVGLSFIILVYILRCQKKGEVFAMNLVYLVDSGKFAGKVKKSEYPDSYSITLISYFVIFLIIILLGLLMVSIAMFAIFIK